MKSNIDLLSEDFEQRVGKLDPITKGAAFAFAKLLEWEIKRTSKTPEARQNAELIRKVIERN